MGGGIILYSPSCLSETDRLWRMTSFKIVKLRREACLKPLSFISLIGLDVPKHALVMNSYISDIIAIMPSGQFIKGNQWKNSQSGKYK
jgi:hypothetical protein